MKHCNHCANTSLNSGYVEMMIDCIRTNQVCAEICSTTAKILSLSYENVDDLVDYCKTICQACARECSKHNNEYYKSCSDACQKSVEACNIYLNKTLSA
ncbi:four-helix bundle copper-binding protein [Aquimarina muelleri]|nr:four-helix bundle copper-binding protein [Aquimarina muelleri]MCX2764738.1 four-helix bundle copper-binding protein [Aquimarina muelleri]